MNIVQTNKAYAPSIGGIETTVTDLSEGLSKKEGASVQVLTCSNPGTLRVQRKTINGVSVTFAPSWTIIASLPISPRYPFLLAGIQGDILHIHEPFPLADLSVLFVPKIFKNFSRIVVSWHGDIVRQKWALGCYRPLIHRFLHKVDRIVVSSSNLIESSEFLPLHKDKCEVIPTGIGLDWVGHSQERSDRVEQIRRQYGTPLILFVGRLVYYKGLEYLLEAMRLLPSGLLLIVGSGPLESELKGKIVELGLQLRVVILPYVTDSELHAFYEASDLLVLPSTERSETYGLVQIEAMACGKPVVSTNLKTGVTFVNQHGITGLTVPVRDSRALATALNELLSDEELRLSLGRNARERAIREFSAERMVDRMFGLYQRLLES